jgi:hypothetical protein
MGPVMQGHACLGPHAAPRCSIHGDWMAAASTDLQRLALHTIPCHMPLVHSRAPAAGPAAAAAAAAAARATGAPPTTTCQAAAVPPSAGHITVPTRAAMTRSCCAAQADDLSSSSSRCCCYCRCFDKQSGLHQCGNTCASAHQPQASSHTLQQPSWAHASTSAT